MSYIKKWWVIKLCIFDYFWVIQNKAKKLMIMLYYGSLTISEKKSISLSDY